jgi:hypothetical protein
MLVHDRRFQSGAADVDRQRPDPAPATRVAGDRSPFVARRGIIRARRP